MQPTVFFRFSKINYEKQKIRLTLSFRNFRISSMEPAASIIEKLGGPDAVAKATGTAYTAPYRWMAKEEKGGTGGRIPQKHWAALIELGKSNGVDLTPNDFFGAQEAAA